MRPCRKLLLVNLDWYKYVILYCKMKYQKLETFNMKQKKHHQNMIHKVGRDKWLSVGTFLTIAIVLQCSLACK